MAFGASPQGTRHGSAGPTPQPPADPTVLLEAPIGGSGLPGATVLRRSGRRLGIGTVRDLLFHLPRRYDDLRELRRLGELRMVADGDVVSARVRVTGIRVEQTWRRRVQRTTAYLADETGEAEATWFGRRFIERRLHEGDEVVISGRIRRRGFAVMFDNPEFQLEDGGELLHAGRIVPIYRLTTGLTATRLRLAVHEALDRAGTRYPEYLPEALIAGEQLVGIGKALTEAHFPSTFDERDAALRRLAFDELLALQLGMVGRRRQRGRSTTAPIRAERGGRAVREAIVASLGRRLGRSVELTPDQATAIEAIRTDLERDVPMLRLLQGDVGSGKTAVAAFALALSALAGRQGALLAPTDLLARQHVATLGALLEDLGIPVTLLTGSLSGAGRAKAQAQLANGQASVAVGTHALLQESVSFADLGLVVIDEQHRFGVEQRGQLEAKAGGRPPHVLLMTATPIPRTLGQVLYADLDVSDLRTPPAGRLPIRTAIRRPDELERLWAFVRAEAELDHRTFVVVPRIAEPDADAVDEEDATLFGAGPDEAAPAAEAEAVRLRELLAEIPVGLVHGRMRPAERDAEMARFRDGELKVLVGTTVIEVGVDVPEATTMIVEGADRFGLAQLHQLRGRVGRGTRESFCVLVSDAAEGAVGYARLKAVEMLRDGFELAERDFELRGEGDVLGLAQSGLPRLRVATLARPEHRDLAVRARGHAERLLDDAGGLPEERGALGRELATGWLARVWAGDPASGT